MAKPSARYRRGMQGRMQGRHHFDCGVRNHFSKSKINDPGAPIEGETLQLPPAAFVVCVIATCTLATGNEAEAGVEASTAIVE